MRSKVQSECLGAIHNVRLCHGRAHGESEKSTDVWEKERKTEERSLRTVWIIIRVVSPIKLYLIFCPLFYHVYGFLVSLSDFIFFFILINPSLE